MMEFRTLRADEIDVRVGSVSQKGATLLFYKDARCDMNILDETVGPANWQRDHKEVKGNLYCGVGIHDDANGWVWKWDCGTESYTEKEKGEASDSFKRACFNWGIGRELYTAPFTFIRCETEQRGDKFYLTKDSQKKINGAFVSDIQYFEKKIISVTVCAKNGDVISLGSANEVANAMLQQEAMKDLASDSEKAAFRALCGKAGVDPHDVLKAIGWKGGLMTKAQHGQALAWLKERGMI